MSLISIARKALYDFQRLLAALTMNVDNFNRFFRFRAFLVKPVVSIKSNLWKKIDPVKSFS